MTTSRRTLLQGTAWAAPAVLATAAIPAYAASPAAVTASGLTEVFEFQPANSTNPAPFTGTTNRDGQGGFDLYTTDGSTASVSITSLTYLVLIPKNSLYEITKLEHNFQVSAAEWSSFSTYSGSIVTLADGTTLSSDNYLIYSTTRTVADLSSVSIAGNDSTPIDGTAISTNIAGHFTDGGNAMIPSEIAGLYTGYIATYSVNGAASTTSSTVAPSTKTS
ncbi:hypothetical protein [Rothia nasimurium]|uniref:hypothetical protein n=1 Tax=Rothia nasimurium TaxID=85336 RepID=UPI001F2DD67F|nr:hypothetical protein [Rothia nasimurium]